MILLVEVRNRLYVFVYYFVEWELGLLLLWRLIDLLYIIVDKCKIVNYHDRLLFLLILLFASISRRSRTLALILVLFGWGSSSRLLNSELFQISLDIPRFRQLFQRIKNDIYHTYLRRTLQSTFTLFRIIKRILNLILNRFILILVLDSLCLMLLVLRHKSIRISRPSSTPIRLPSLSSTSATWRLLTVRLGGLIFTSAFRSISLFYWFWLVLTEHYIENLFLLLLLLLF